MTENHYSHYNGLTPSPVFDSNLMSITLLTIQEKILVEK